MTEEEAKKCWCPFSRVACGGEEEEAGRVMPDLPALNRVGQVKGPTLFPAASRCIGSACMAWREVFGISSLSYTDDNPLLPIGKMKKLGGYCGLAGKP